MGLNDILPLPSATSDIDIGKRNIDTFGVTIHERFLSQEQVSLIKNRLVEQAELEYERGVATFDDESSDSEENFPGDQYKLKIGRPSKIPTVQSITFLVNKGRCFIDLASHPLAIEYVNHILGGKRFNVSGQVGFITRNGAHPQHIHSDQQYMPFLTPTPLSASIMVALGDYEEDMGATRIIPGSQTWPYPKIGTQKDVKTVPIVMSAGSAAIWESRVWHGRGESVSDKTRYSVFTEYIINFIKPLNCHPASIHDIVYNTMSDQERELYDFGYLLYSGNICPRSALDNRQNVNHALPYIPKLERNSSMNAE